MKLPESVYEKEQEQEVEQEREVERPSSILWASA